MNFSSALLDETAHADPGQVDRLRQLLGQTLHEATSLDVERHADIVLATVEALSNCAEHAYPATSTSTSTMTLVLHHDVVHHTLEIRVTDRGTWTEPATPPTAPSLRGRGLTLMHALTDDVTIHGTSAGTTVRLRFHRCPGKVEHPETQPSAVPFDFKAR